MIALGRSQNVHVGVAPVWSAVSGWGASVRHRQHGRQGYTIGPGALVVQEVAPETTVTGVPALALPVGNFGPRMLKAEP